MLRNACHIRIRILVYAVLCEHMIKITGEPFGKPNFCWSKRGQNWNGLRRSEKRIRNVMGGNSLEVEETLFISLFQSPERHSRPVLSPNGR